MTYEEQNRLLNEQHTIVHEMRGELRKLDYVGIKIATGKGTKTEYKEKIELAQSYRDRLNAALEEIDRLKAVEIEEPEMPEDIAE